MEQKQFEKICHAVLNVFKISQRFIERHAVKDAEIAGMLNEMIVEMECALLDMQVYNLIIDDQAKLTKINLLLDYCKDLEGKLKEIKLARMYAITD